jgi:hypothetical protein
VTLFFNEKQPGIKMHEVPVQIGLFDGQLWTEINFKNFKYLIKPVSYPHFPELHES